MTEDKNGLNKSFSFKNRSQKLRSDSLLCDLTSVESLKTQSRDPRGSKLHSNALPWYDKALQQSLLFRYVVVQMVAMTRALVMTVSSVVTMRILVLTVKAKCNEVDFRILMARMDPKEQTATSQLLRLATVESMPAHLNSYS